MSRGLYAVFSLLVAASPVVSTDSVSGARGPRSPSAGIDSRRAPPDGTAEVGTRPPPSSEKAITLRLPPDIVFDKAKDAPSAVVFSHASHVALEGNRCLSCHPRPFRMLRPSRHVTHAEMDARTSCGSCHDGKSAFATSDPERCDGCHGGQEAGR